MLLKVGDFRRKTSSGLELAVSSKMDRLWEKKIHHLEEVQEKQCPQRRTRFQ